MKTNMTITQAKNVIYKRIENLEKKIENAK